MATVSKQQIADFVAANLDNPQAIADAAAQYGVSSSDIAQAMNVDVGVVSNYFTNANVQAPPVMTPSETIVAASPTPVPTPTPTPTPVPTPTPTPTPPPLVVTQPTVYPVRPATQPQIQAAASYAPDAFTAISNGTARVQMDATGNPQIVDKTTGTPFNTQGLTIQILPNNQLSILGWGGKAQQLQATTSIDSQGNIAPIQPQNIQQAGLINTTGGTNLFQAALEIGLAYALPIVGESIAASLTTAGIATSASVGTALAAIGTGVAQGQTLEQAITNAAPNLIASGVMSQFDMGSLSSTITSNPTVANVVNNVAGSVIATAAKGGNAQDLLTNAIAAGGGTLIGDSLQGQGVSPSTAQAVGRTIATTAATGNVVSGLSSGAGSLGGTQASQNAVTRNFDNMIPTTASDGSQVFYDPKTGIQYNADGSVNTPAAKTATSSTSNIPADVLPVVQALAKSSNLSLDEAYKVYQYSHGVNDIGIEPSPIITALATASADAQNLIATGQWTLGPDGTSATDRDGNIHYKKADGNWTDPSYASSPPPVANTPVLQKGIDATNAAIQANGVPSGAIINNPQVKSYTDTSTGNTGFSVETNVVATSPDGKQTGYVIVYEPISGKTVYTYNYTDPTTNNVQVIAGKVPPNFDTTTQSFVGATPTTETITPEVINNSINAEPITQDTGQAPISTDTTNIPSTTVVPSKTTTTGQAPVTTTDTTNIPSNTVIPTTTSPTATQTGTGGTGTATPTNALSSTTGTPGTAGPTGPGIPGVGTGTGPGGGGGTGTGGGLQNTGSNLAGFGTGPTPGGGGAGTGGGGTGTGGTPTPTPSPSPTLTSIPEVIGPVTTPETTPPPEQTTDPTPITITASTVKPPTIKAALPTIQGQFASPLTAAVSSYIPAGEIPGTETGKPREDVWNQESLREGLGL